MKTIARSPRLVALALATTLTLSACGFPGGNDREGEGTDTGGGTTEETAAEESAEPAAEPAETAASGGPAAGGDSTTVDIGTEFTDTDTGDVITIVSAVRNNPTEYYEASSNPNGEMIYLEVSVDPGEDYGGSLSSSEFYLDSGGEEANYASTASPELEEAGYTYFDTAPRRDGEHSGYIPIFVPESAPTIEGSYVRPEADIIGEDRSLPEFEGTFTIPAA